MNNIANTIILIASFITAVSTILLAMHKILKKMFEPINSKIDGLDLSQARNYLVNAKLSEHMSYMTITQKICTEIVIYMQNGKKL